MYKNTLQTWHQEFTSCISTSKLVKTEHSAVVTSEESELTMIVTTKL